MYSDRLKRSLRQKKERFKLPVICDVMFLGAYEMIKSRVVVETDWPRIDYLASNAVQEADHSGNESEWKKRRLEFNGIRHHSVVESSSQVVGYCSLERSTDETKKGFRAFLVTDWNPENAEIHQALFDQLEVMISTEKINHIWMRELTDDVKLLEFAVSKGFSKQKPYRIGDLQMVNLSKEYRHDERHNK